MEKIETAFGQWNQEGTSLPNFVHKDVLLDEIKNFEVKEDDVWLCTFPKSGTHWTMQIIRLLQNGGDLDKMVAETNKLGVIPGTLEMSVTTPSGDVNHGYKFFQELPSPRFIFTHLPLHLMPKQFLEKKPKVIYISRNPRDNAVSFFHFFTPTMEVLDIEFSWEEYIDMYMLGKQLYGPWASHVLPYWKHRNDPNFMFIKYEDMKADHTGVVRKIANHLGYTTSEEIIKNTVENSSVKRTKDAMKMIPQLGIITAHKYGAVVRKGIVDDWKSQFTVAQSEAFHKAVLSDIKGSGLDY